MNGLAARRTVLRSAMGLALLPLLASRPALAAGAPAPAFAPPSGDMIYRRTLQRPLPGGITLSATRDFRVRFTGLADGYRVDGAQVAARVDAPAALASLARLEEQRVEEGVFPMVLDPQGHIVSGHAVDGDIVVAAAIADARQRFEDHGAEIGELLDALSASGASITAYLPLDLFAPQESASERRETIALPWGMAGEVRVVFNATRDAASGLMRLASREVITSLQGEERRSAERWELFPV